ncbi:MAG: hypothetical protein A2Z20_12700 [Bdellovibrionales bacterium RBG_16_40_8]|nr:MAG: hypothetical protein A2Z20_12700 [Bdellovibrionales bacterium RBG_16_40_8]
MRNAIFLPFCLLLFTFSIGCSSFKSLARAPNPPNSGTDSGNGANEKCGDLVTLTWDAPTTNTDGSPLSDLAGYKVYYGGQSKVYATTIDTADMVNNSYGISGLAPNTYYFAVTAYDSSNNESDYSNEVYITLKNCPANILSANLVYESGRLYLSVYSL